ncbi:MAG TPA: hypothetical protein VNI77_11555 [Nitrososphaera sp.]|nr:hypothetical protein [Nitrososphaera sp.]
MSILPGVPSKDIIKKPVNEQEFVEKIREAKAMYMSSEGEHRPTTSHDSEELDVLGILRKLISSSKRRKFSTKARFF